MNKDNIIRSTVISIFVILYALTSLVSTIHVIDFFRLSNPEWLANSLAITFEVGAAASLAAIVILDKTNRALVWALFTLITLMQIMGNLYYSFTHVENFQSWSELFGIIEEDVIYQKRVISVVSGGILPLVALGFIKSLVDYVKPAKETQKTETAIIEMKESPIEISEPIEVSLDEPISGEELDPEETIKEEYEESVESLLTEEDVDFDSEDEDKDSTGKEKIRKTEEKIAKVIAKNPEIKKQIEEKLREFESEDKYTKTDTAQNEEDSQPAEPIRVVTSGM